MCRTEKTEGERTCTSKDGFGRNIINNPPQCSSLLEQTSATWKLHGAKFYKPPSRWSIGERSLPNPFCECIDSTANFWVPFLGGEVFVTTALSGAQSTYHLPSLSQSCGDPPTFRPVGALVWSPGYVAGNQAPFFSHCRRPRRLSRGRDYGTPLHGRCNQGCVSSYLRSCIGGFMQFRSGP